MRSTVTKICGVVLAAALVGGCMGTKKPAEPKGAAWAKEGATDQQLRADFGLCGGAFDDAGNFKYAEDKLEAIDGCMTGKGYKRTR